MVLDIETDGNGSFRPPTQRPIEIAWSIHQGENTLAQHQVFVSGIQVIKYKDSRYTVEEINRRGIPFEQALLILHESIREHGVELLVGHNIAFDQGCIFHHAQKLKKFVDFVVDFANLPLFCTMRQATPVCKIKFKDSLRYKWPTLQELAHHFDVPLKPDDLHTAAYDVWVTNYCYRKLLALEVGSQKAATGSPKR